MIRKVLYILGQLCDTDIDWVASVGVRKYLCAGEILIHQGKPIDAVYIVLEGCLSVLAQGESTEIARIGAGEIVGEMSYVDSRPPLATVMALERSLVLAIPRPLLTEKLEQDSAFAAHFFRALAIFLSSRLRDTVGLLGYGVSRPLAQSVDNELDDNLLDTVYLAGSRFERLLKDSMGT